MVEYKGGGEISADRRLQPIAQLDCHERVHPHFKETLILVKGLRGVQSKHLRQFVANVYGQESNCAIVGTFGCCGVGVGVGVTKGFVVAVGVGSGVSPTAS